MSFKEEILFSEYSDGWNRNMPVTLITYDDGKMDVHCQTGDHHIKAIDKARAILWKKGLAVGPDEAVGGSGIYYPVKPLKE